MNILNSKSLIEIMALPTIIIRNIVLYPQKNQRIRGTSVAWVPKNRNLRSKPMFSVTHLRSYLILLKYVMYYQDHPKIRHVVIVLEKTAKVVKFQKYCLSSSKISRWPQLNDAPVKIKTTPVCAPKGLACPRELEFVTLAGHHTINHNIAGKVRIFHNPLTYFQKFPGNTICRKKLHGIWLILNSFKNV